MRRAMLQHLAQWLASENRKPLIIGGARQVGKTWLARAAAKEHGMQLLELNFEKQPALASLFESNDVQQVLPALQSHFECNIVPEVCLLFLDEIQAAPAILAKLRWFAEDLPQLPVIAAGSLLEFTLAEHTLSMPVGRINYLHLEPLSFEEFLLARGAEQSCELLASFQLGDTLPGVLHDKLMGFVKEYFIVGGMPAAVSQWIETNSLQQVNQIQHDLLATYRDDFAKYAPARSLAALESLLLGVPMQLGQKFVYARANADMSSATLKKALDLLTKAKILYPVRCVSGNGTPLAAEVKEKYFKMTLLDVGLVSSMLKLKLTQFPGVQDLMLVNQGGVSEQVVGQMLRTLEPPYVAPELYYWMRTSRGAEAEVDYLLSLQNKVIPVEVKSGSAGAMKSLHYFMAKKDYHLAVRINGDLPSMTEVQVKTSLGREADYRLLSVPFYLVGQLCRLLEHTAV